MKVDRFAFTANNVTCAAMGDELKCWHILPASQGVRQHSWGFGEVIASARLNAQPSQSRRFCAFRHPAAALLAPE